MGGIRDVLAKVPCIEIGTEIKLRTVLEQIRREGIHQCVHKRNVVDDPALVLVFVVASAPALVFKTGKTHAVFRTTLEHAIDLAASQGFRCACSSHV